MTVKEFLDTYMSGGGNYFDKDELNRQFNKENGRLVTEQPEQLNEQGEKLLMAQTHYDLRKVYPHCILEPVVQGRCDSCWAFASVRVLQERLCIKERKQIPRLSPQYMISCFQSSSGCNSQDMSQPLIELEYKGTVTDQCLPYHSRDGFFKQCNQVQVCEDKSTPQFFFLKQGESKIIMEKPELAKAELLSNGSLYGYFEIYQNILSYKGGIYQDAQGAKLGGHVVSIIGFGVENGVEYWIGANSWGPNWGEGGFYKMKRGVANSDYYFMFGDPILQK